MFFSSQHFWGRKACWNFKMGLRWIHKQEFKMESTCTTNDKRRLVPNEHKWCNKFSKDNLKHKLYTARNLWEEGPFPSL
jgi:hypothetical protein